jgi:putative transposase
MDLLFEAKKRHDLSILNFIVTSNHIHLIISSNDNKTSIPRAIQFIAGRTGQEYNRRKGRKGAFWDDRYHATAIQAGDHLWRCMVYVDLNMVRAGCVDHPRKWKWSGYHEIQKPKKRYRLIDHDRLCRVLNYDNYESLAKTHRQWVESQLLCGLQRQEHYSRSIAVGNEVYIRHVQQVFGVRAVGRRAFKTVADEFQLRETISKYK